MPIWSSGTQCPPYSAASLGLHVLGPHANPPCHIILTPGRPVIFCGLKVCDFGSQNKSQTAVVMCDIAVMILKGIEIRLCSRSFCCNKTNPFLEKGLSSNSNRQKCF